MQLEADVGKPEKDWQRKRKRRAVMAYEALYNGPDGITSGCLCPCGAESVLAVVLRVRGPSSKVYSPGNSKGTLQGLR